MDANTARKAGLSSTVVFPTGNVALEGSVIKATAIDASVVDPDSLFRQRGRVRFTDEREVIEAGMAALATSRSSS